MCKRDMTQSKMSGTMVDTGWRKLIRSSKLQIIFHKRATKYRSFLRKMTYKDKGSYESSPLCILAIDNPFSLFQFQTHFLVWFLPRKVPCCSVLQCVAVRCSALQCVAVCCRALQCVAVCCSVLQCVAVCCSVLQCVAVRCSLRCTSKSTVTDAHQMVLNDI